MSDTIENLLIKVKSLKNMLTARATGGNISDPDYKQIRKDLIANTLLNGRLPCFVETCRSSEEFRGFIKPKFAHYAPPSTGLGAKYTKPLPQAAGLTFQYVFCHFGWSAENFREVEN